MAAKEKMSRTDQAGAKQRLSVPTADQVAPQTERPAHPATIIQRARRDPRSLTPRAVLQLHRTLGNRAVGRLLTQPVQRQAAPTQENHTGLPDPLKAGVEALSRLSLDDVQVHYNSPKPAQLQALAYTQGMEIHVGPGQEQHLPHEAWHVVQQMQGRVQPTLQAKDPSTGLRETVSINDDVTLEREADVMGAKVLQLAGSDQIGISSASLQRVQRVASPFRISSKFPIQQNGRDPIQRASAKDVYKGGAELEYRKGKAELTFSNLKEVSTLQYDEAKVKEMIRLGMKGISISSIALSNLSDETELKGKNWDLTVETNSGTQLDSEGKITVVLELILGGPEGSTLGQLKTASNESATAVASLDTKTHFSFPENVGNVIRDNVKSKYNKRAQAEAELKNKDVAEQVDLETHPLSKDWSKINVMGTWDKQNSIPSKGEWGLQITLGAPLAELENAQKALINKNLSDVSSAKPKPASEPEVVWSAQDILEKMHDTNPLTDKPLNQKTEQELWKERHHNEGFNQDSPEHLKWSEDTMKSQNEEKTANLHNALNAKVKEKNSENSAPSLATLNGLCRVLAAYVRGQNGGPEQGPKHTMKLVNKNPLQDVIRNAAATMMNDNDNDEWYKRLRNACVDMVIHTRGANTYNWVGHQLKVEEWGTAMKDRDIDLVSVYDKAYRSAQIGHLSSLNDVSSVPHKGNAAPIIEFRDLGSTQPSKMADIFQGIINSLDPEPASPGS